MNSVIVMMTFNIVYTAVVCWSLLVTILFPTYMLAMFDDLKDGEYNTQRRCLDI